MNNQTNEKDLANSGDEAQNSALDKLRPIWQSLWSPNRTYEEFLAMINEFEDVDVDEIRELLDE